MSVSYRCPDCGMVSHNPNDAINRYCGACKDFKEPELKAKLLRQAQTAAMPRCACGNILGLQQVICGRCRRAEAELNTVKALSEALRKIIVLCDKEVPHANIRFVCESTLFQVD